MPTPSISYVEQLLGVIHEVVPELKFCARLLLCPTRDTDSIYLFGVHMNGRVVGGYEVRYCLVSSDILEHGLDVARFFHKATLKQPPVFEPPELRGLWEDASVRAILFPEGAT